MRAIHGSPLPLYHQLKADIQAKVASGELQPDQQLPGERHLELQYGVSRTTVRQAITELVHEGVLERRHGVGTFVAHRRVKQSLSSLMGFAETLYEQGLPVRIEVLEKGAATPPAQAAKALDLAAGAYCSHVSRRFWLNNAPLYIDNIYLPDSIGALVMNAPLESEPIYSIVERHGYRIADGVQTIRAVSLARSEAALLECKTGLPGLLVERTTYLDNGVPLEYSVSLYRGDRYEYKTKLMRGPLTF